MGSLHETNPSIWAVTASDGPTHPRLEASTDADVVVVGAGIAGLAAAQAVRRERPDVEVVVLEASTVLLADKVRRLDPAASRALVPYVAWNAFAAALNAAIARRN
jgi:flavin-dependent dehydrogenase